MELVLSVVLSKLESLQIMGREGTNMFNAMVVWLTCKIDFLKDEIILVI